MFVLAIISALVGHFKKTKYPSIATAIKITQSFIATYFGNWKFNADGTALVKPMH